MRTPLMIGLAGVLGATLWLSSLDEGEGGADAVEVVTSRRPADAAPASPGTRAPDATSLKATSTAAPASTPAASVQAALQSGLGGWLARRTEAATLPPARPMTAATPSAWAAQLPPPPPAPRRVVQEAPPPPMAPRFPHAWVGRFNDESASRPLQRAVVSGPVSTWVVSAGDVIDGQWRVDRIQGHTMSLTYLPLQQSQIVSMK
ncbi:MAG: hypothetical protein I8H88_04000 [Burkholderiales bacterium]|nr:hypothetical protein [Burkholderiales bacterium]